MMKTMSELENNVKASAVMNFVEAIRGAYGAGFVDNNPTVYDIYRSAQHHVKDNYGIDTEIWDDDLAKESRSEWRNGDKAMLGDSEVLVIGYHPEHPAIVVEGGDGLDIVGICSLKKLRSEV
ncbi:hypothetical protein [Vibrio harveyi]|uniref:hypothetical protein n=1 Tax=Vibrio harveyi TaxID=669 RepID=UPI0025B21D3C|nr:hypothetical protein [Vibrio harveyi]WJT09267.1 hypothetical protein PH545_24890 [Vibrio harveyi]